MTIFKLVLISTLMMILSCAPKVKEKVFETPKLVLGPRLSDTTLNINANATTSLTKLSTPGSSVESQFELIENLFQIYDITKDARYLAFAKKLRQNFYASKNKYSEFTLSSSPYLSAFVALGEDSVLEQLSELSRYLSVEQKK